MQIERVPAPTYEGEAATEATRAAERRAHALLQVQNARQRAALYPRPLIVELGIGVTGMMLAMVVRGEIVPKDAKQALDIAKIALDVVRMETGADASVSETPADRQAKIARATNIIDIFKKRDGASGDVAAHAEAVFDQTQWEDLG